eukprot:gb/GECH01012901.1/.p1 GENE.gb/GECH01012901.1/~~gb/GECH01012901.1/.p1  ORF type:complete len:368 (+),score=56.39 gb/GECH01012901.1/:1-1104(+)
MNTFLHEKKYCPTFVNRSRKGALLFILLVILNFFLIPKTARAVSHPSPGDIVSSCVEPGVVALTFDDGPSENTLKIVNYLNSRDIPATFFVVGQRLNLFSLRSITSYAFRSGHEIASHTYTHPRLTLLTDEEIKKEMILTEKNIIRATGKRSAWMRPPYGLHNDRVRDKMKDLGYSLVMWNLDSIDWKYRQSQPEKIVTNVKQGIQGKSPNDDSFILLMHDLYAETAERVPAIVDLLASRGFRLVTVSECLHGPSATPPNPLQISYRTQYRWRTGMQGIIQLTVPPETPTDAFPDRWRIAFNKKPGVRITVLLNGVIVEQSAERVVVRNAIWNGRVTPMETISVGFIASVPRHLGHDNPVDNFRLYD